MALHWTINLVQFTSVSDVDIVCVALPNNLHRRIVRFVGQKHKKAVMVTKPLGRNAEEAKRMLEAVESAGYLIYYLEDLYIPRNF